MKLEDKPESHIKLAKKATDACIEAATNGSTIKAGNLTVELLEANKPYMDEASKARAELTTSAIRSGKIRYNGAMFSSRFEELEGL